jgi:hypothetical protein
MNDSNEQFEERLRQDLSSLADRVSIDNLEGKVGHRLQRRTMYRRMMVGGTIAAALLFIGYWITFVNPSFPIPQPSFTSTDVDKMITDAGMSTELLLTAQVLDKTPGGEKLALENYQYIIAKYRDTRAARQADEQIHNIYNRRTIQ